MKHRKLFALVTVLFLTVNLSLTAFAADWNLAQQGDLNITADGDYNIISADKNGKPISTKNAITIADNVNAKITLDNVAIESSDAHGIQIGSGANVTLNLVGDNSILDSDKSPIENKSSNLTITSACGGTLKLQDEEPVMEVTASKIEIDQLLSLGDIDAERFVVVEDEGYVLQEWGSIEGNIEVGQGSIISIDIITDESVPLSDGQDAAEEPSTITIEGNAQIDSSGDLYSANSSYIIGFDAVINGIPGWDIETLSQYVPYEKDYSDLILMVEGKPLQNCRILKNKSKNITVIVSDAEESVKLAETGLKNKQLTEGVEKENILHACNLSLGKNYQDNFIVRFHLGETYAGKTVEIRTMENDKMSAETIVVSESGIAAVAASASGDFALIAK